MRRRLLQFLSCAALLVAPLVGGCHPKTVTKVSPAEEAWQAANDSNDAEVVGRWALAEMLAPGGTASGAVQAMQRLGRGGLEHPGMYAALARAIYEEVHGDPRAAADAYVATLVAARGARGDEDAPLVSWYATHHLLALRGPVTGLFAHNRKAIEGLIASPGDIGWRAEADLVEWASAEAYDRGENLDDAEAARTLGCAEHIRLAGPFGHGAPADRRRSYGPEAPGPWPPAWPADAARGITPHILPVEQQRCYAGTTEDVGDGVFYSETFFTTDESAEVLVAVQGAVAVWVDDKDVLERDLREWGVWQKFGVVVRVGAGRHRVLARLMGDGSSVRLLTPDGRPAKLRTDTDDRLGYSPTPPVVLADPNAISRIVTAAAHGEPGAPWLRASLAAQIAHFEGQDDVADVLVAPLVDPKNAAPVALELAADLPSGDTALAGEVQQRVENDLRTRAVAGDPRLWASRSWLIATQAKQRGLIEGVEPYRQLVREFPSVPEITGRLAQVYSELGWRAERMKTVEELATRFPDDVAALRLQLAELDETGSLKAADAVAARIAKLDPDNEVLLDRSLARHDWKTAIAQLRRIGKRRPERKDIAVRVADVLARAGDPTAAAAQLSKALAKNPEDSSARFRLADEAYAAGDRDALRRALAEALQAGGKTAEMRAAIDLLEGATDLEPYRQDGRAVIREFEAWEKTGKHMDGTSARVLDYSALWVHPDASSEMLEHEILRIQSQEAVGEEAEQPLPGGLVLHLRVIKPDGRVLEPEPVSGKQTLTMPHLEVGDYVEIEHITEESGDGEKGKRYRGPVWFFREPDKGYWRSEFVTITPKDRALEIETHGNVPPPVKRPIGDFEERRWRVDLSPPAPKEPDSAPLQEFLPSVRLGWGISLADTLDRLVDVASQETPLDPRLRVEAENIVKAAPPGRIDEEIRLLYEDVTKNVQDGNENDGRRVLTGKSGSRPSAFQYLVRELGIPIDAALVKNRLAMPPLGPMSEVEAYDGLLFRVRTNDAARPFRWLTIRDKFAPAWYVPAEYRGEPAFVLVPGTPKATTPAGGATDGIAFDGNAELHPDGSASAELTLRFEGKAGIGVRNVFDKLQGAQLREFIESSLVGRNLPGAQLKSFSVEHKDDPNAPFLLHVSADVPQLARPVGAGLRLEPIFPMNLAQLAALPERQTPLLLGSAYHAEVRFAIAVPPSLHLPKTLTPATARDGERSVEVSDHVEGSSLVLNRAIDMPAGRVQPGEDYARFVRFIRAGDEIVQRELVIGR